MGHSRPVTGLVYLNILLRHSAVTVDKVTRSVVIHRYILSRWSSGFARDHNEIPSLVVFAHYLALPTTFISVVVML